MSKISNMLQLINLLNTGKKYSVRQLSETLEVSERMIRSYRDELEIAGIYITGIKGPYGGYVLDKRVIIPAVRITQKDIELLESSNNKKEFGDFINKLKMIVEEYDFNKIQTSGEKFSSFQRAIKQKGKVKITYDSSTVGPVERIIHPIEMFLFTKGWFVVSYCEMRKDMRNFELDSILEFKVLQDKF